MKSGPLLFLGIFSALALSWAVLVFGSSWQLANLRPFVDPIESTIFPQPIPGQSERGMAVYLSLGCAACHTQQVRRPGYGYDKERGWGDRQSVARDYLYYKIPVLGQGRRGPDLSNFAGRAIKTGVDRDRLLLSLYAEHQPCYRFLFERRKIEGLPLPGALKVPTPPGEQILPSPRTEDLVVYLLNLKQDYLFPEAQPSEAPADKKP